MTAEDAIRIVEERQLEHVKVGLFDIDGVMRGKYMSREKFFSALRGGFAFCDVVLGWDSNDQLYSSPGVEFTGWHTGYPDAPVRVIPRSCRDLPFEGDMLLFLCEFADQAEAICPRNLLGRVLDRAQAIFACSRAAQIRSNTKIGQISITLFIKQDVGGFYVAVHNLLVMRGGQPARHLIQQNRRRFQIKGAFV